MPLGFHADCPSSGKWVKDGVCSACGERVFLLRREPLAPEHALDDRIDERPASGDRWAHRLLVGQHGSS